MIAIDGSRYHRKGIVRELRKNERDVRFYVDIGSNGEIKEIEREDNRNWRENKESMRDEKKIILKLIVMMTEVYILSHV